MVLSVTGMRLTFQRATLVAVMLYGGWVTQLKCVATENAEDFVQTVAPILERRCLSCHAGSNAKGDFSLETGESALADGFIESGDAASSYLMELVTPVNGHASMPKDADPLSAAELTSLRRWIDSGANWPADVELKEPRVSDFGWWSYQPIQRPTVPMNDTLWARTPIDQFIQHRLQQKGLTPSPPADRRTLIRRVTFDLTGLPPTPDEVADFVNDQSPDAWEELVDGLLNSPHYGERWARHWLDVVRYADTCGYDKDKLRPNAWPYRDYVIRAFNEDKPYGRFIREQIAGDILFPGEPDGIVGLGFIAAGPWDFIGHVEVPESKLDGKVARNLDRDDMVSNTLNTFCSTTVQCARCHNHKFDPITQQHYYGLQAVFAAVDRAERLYDTDPKVEKRREELNAKLQAHHADLKAADAQRVSIGGERLAQLNDTIKTLHAKIQVKKDPAFGFHSQMTSDQTAEKWIEVDLGGVKNAVTIVLNPCHDDHAKIGAGFGFPHRFRVAVATDAGKWTVVHDQTKTDLPNPGVTAVVVQPAQTQFRYVRMTATKLKHRSAEFHFALAELQALSPDGINYAAGAKVTSSDSIEAPVRWSRRNVTDGKWPTAMNPEVAAARTQAVRERSKALDRPEIRQLQERCEILQKNIAQTKKQIADLPKGRLVYAAATHFTNRGQFKSTDGKPRPIHVLHRGNIQQPGAAAVPGVIPLSADADWTFENVESEGRRRAALADWIVNPDNPLTWRSIVNRIWQYHFGQGIVATPSDFGRMGAKPTHPELLDWLAVEFRDGGQSFRKLHRQILMSSVYQQASTHNVQNAEIDGSNQYLWRANRRRLEAEEIRDAMLSVSGLLRTDAGGPGFYLFNLEKTEHSPHYEYHKFDPADEESHRRSIYRFIVRSQPDPWMTTLDCADSSQSTPRRSETLTSLQALSLMNSRFNVYAGQQFATRMQKQNPELADQVDRAFWLVCLRSPTATERQDLVTYAETHGLSNLCRFLMNLSEFVFVD